MTYTQNNRYSCRISAHMRDASRAIYSALYIVRLQQEQCRIPTSAIYPKAAARWSLVQPAAANPKRTLAYRTENGIRAQENTAGLQLLSDLVRGTVE